MHRPTFLINIKSIPPRPCNPIGLKHHGFIKLYENKIWRIEIGYTGLTCIHYKGIWTAKPHLLFPKCGLSDRTQYQHLQKHSQ